MTIIMKIWDFVQCLFIARYFNSVLKILALITNKHTKCLSLNITTRFWIWQQTQTYKKSVPVWVTAIITLQCFTSHIWTNILSTGLQHIVMGHPRLLRSKELRETGCLREYIFPMYISPNERQKCGPFSLSLQLLESTPKEVHVFLLSDRTAIPHNVVYEVSCVCSVF
jgi:hypothetical protein